MDNPKVSIIVPIYRVEEYIERCAESLFAQTFDDIEYIFVDDCSPDKSVEILQRTLEKYPHRKRLTRIERLSLRTLPTHRSTQHRIKCQWRIKPKMTIK